MYYFKQVLLLSIRHPLGGSSHTLLLQWPPNGEHLAVNLTKPFTSGRRSLASEEFGQPIS